MPVRAPAYVPWLRDYTEYAGHYQISREEVDAMHKELGILGKAPAAL